MKLHKYKIKSEKFATYLICVYMFDYILNICYWNYFFVPLLQFII